mmetsp:Transcript_9125/g.17192  ORF Transcript_9125/g.17192 Transcript_9125/m.17192 type:complete len:214 (-) Transcript_9125:543-1184(-)
MAALVLLVWCSQASTLLCELVWGVFSRNKGGVKERERSGWCSASESDPWLSSPAAVGAAACSTEGNGAFRVALAKSWRCTCVASKLHSTRPASTCCSARPWHPVCTFLNQHTLEPTGLIPSISRLAKSPARVSKCTPVLWRIEYRPGPSGSTKPKISQPARQRARPWPTTATLLATTVASGRSRLFCNRTVATTPCPPGRNGSGQSMSTLQIG